MQAQNFSNQQKGWRINTYIYIYLMGTNNHKCSLTGVVPSPHSVVVIVEVASAVVVVVGKDNFC